MKKIIVLFAALTFVVAWAGLAAGDWLPGWDDYKMHYPQLPDTTTTGWDVLSSGVCAEPGCRVADDFMCTETGWVKDIHFWGSWKNDQVGQIQYFHFEIFEDNAGQPGQRIWWYDAPIAGVGIVTKSAPGEGWWKPCTPPEVLPLNHAAYYQYNVNVIQNRWFCQEQGHVYWLSVYACLAGPGPQWGWKTSISVQYGEDGMYGNTGGPWVGSLVDPTTQLSRDLAFVITGDAAPPARVPSLTEWGVIILAMLIAAAGVIAVLRRRATVRAC